MVLKPVNEISHRKLSEIEVKYIKFVFSIFDKCSNKNEKLVDLLWFCYVVKIVFIAIEISFGDEFSITADSVVVVIIIVLLLQFLLFGLFFL